MKSQISHKVSLFFCGFFFSASGSKIFQVSVVFGEQICYIYFYYKRPFDSNLLLNVPSQYQRWCPKCIASFGEYEEDPCFREEYIAASLLHLIGDQMKTKEKDWVKQNNSRMICCYLKDLNISSNNWFAVRKQNNCTKFKYFALLATFK